MAQGVGDGVCRSYLENGLSVCDVQRLIFTARMRRIFWFLNHRISLSRSKVVREKVIEIQEKVIRHCHPCHVSTLHGALPAQCLLSSFLHDLLALQVPVQTVQPFCS
jgi:hypothetical protein